MPTTPTYALPYPAAGDAPDIPVDIRELADRLEVVLPTIGGGGGSLPPVVNGKWIKGVSGAAVWSDITQADVAGLVADMTAKANAAATTASLALKEDKASKGVASGYASLDSGGKVPAGQLPAAGTGLEGLVGTVDVNGNKINGTGWTSVQNAGPVYVVTFAVAFAVPPAVFVTFTDGTASSPFVTVATTGFTMAAPGASARPFNFAALKVV